MTIMKAQFAGEIKKADHKEVGGKKLVEVSICKKNRGKQGDPDVFSWLRIAIWSPAEFQIPKLVKGAFIAGSGDMQLRSYEGKDGKATSLECTVTSFDVEVSDGSPRAEAAPAPAPAPRKPASRGDPGGGASDNEPPFNRYLSADHAG